MIKNELLNVIGETWPSVLICVIILVTLRIMMIYKNKEQIIIHKEFISLSFMIYILCLFHVVTSQDSLSASSNLVPFKEIMRYTFGSNLFIKNVIGNMLMFFPYGLFIAYFLKLKKGWVPILLSLLVSSSIETTQLLIGRIFDIDDIILNTIGGAIGGYTYICFNSIQNKLPSFLKKDWFYNIIVLVIFLVLVFFMLRYI